MVGLVIDVGFLLAQQRHAQNAADCAATAAALDLLLEAKQSVATATARAYVTDYNGLTDAQVEVNIPPASGPYQGEKGFVEVLVAYPVNTFFIHILPGVASQSSVRARAVAGAEYISVGKGVVVLDPDARPGLKVTGGAELTVEGKVFVNSEGGGYDEDGLPVDNFNDGYAGTVANNSLLRATAINVVGGVDHPENFEPFFPGDPDPLHIGVPPLPDPLLNLPTPTVALGVDPTERGTPRANNPTYSGDGLTLLSDGLEVNDPLGVNYKYQIDPNDPLSPSVMVLHPGIYTSMSINGGQVKLIPGIYVIRPNVNTQNALKITGGDVDAEGIMIYATGHNFNPTNGTPDKNDRSKPPPAEDGASFGVITLNAGMRFSPIDTTIYDYASLYPGAPAVSPEFDGMLFYQRRRNTATISIQGDSGESLLTGTVYAKWAHFKLASSGRYDAFFVLGSLTVTGQADVTVGYLGNKLIKAPQVFLVE